MRLKSFLLAPSHTRALQSTILGEKLRERFIVRKGEHVRLYIAFIYNRETFPFSFSYRLLNWRKSLCRYMYTPRLFDLPWKRSPIIWDQTIDLTQLRQYVESLAKGWLIAGIKANCAIIFLKCIEGIRRKIFYYIHEFYQSTHVFFLTIIV